jgi:hypothetical protein
MPRSGSIVEPEAVPSNLPQRDSLSQVGIGCLGGTIGTSGMILMGLLAIGLAGVPPSQWASELALGFGGPSAVFPASGLGPEFVLHYLHGIVLGAAFGGGYVVASRRFPFIAGRLPLFGILFGFVLAAVVLVLMVVTVAATLTTGTVGLVILLHATFGSLVGETQTIGASRGRRLEPGTSSI